MPLLTAKPPALDLQPADRAAPLAGCTPGAASPKLVCVEGKYSIELFCDGGEGAGLQEVMARGDNLAMARAIYKLLVSQRPGRLIMLCNRARVLARSDRPETMPQ